jgi:L-malate glycosyltransferase
VKLLFTNFHDGDGGGHTRYILTLVQALVSHHEVHVAAPPGSRLHRQAQGIEGVRVWDQPFPNGLNRWAARRRARHELARCLREQNFDLVHVNGSADHRLVLAAMPSGRKPRVVLTKHNSKPMTGVGQWWRARRTDLVIAVCDYTRRELEHSSYRRCRLATVHNGVDVAYYAPWPASDAAAARARWGVDEQVLLLGSNAGTAEYKGWMDLVEALPLLPEAARSQVRVILAGQPPKPAQVTRIAELGLTGHVLFSGLLDDTRLVVAGIDVGFVLSHGVETISFACREMMAMGKPMLLTDYAGLPENIVPGRDGWLVPPRTPSAIATVIEQLLRERELLPAMSEAAREHAKHEFDVSLFVTRTESAYRQLLAAPG